MDNNLQTFIGKILSIAPQYINVFGKGMPGMTGRSAGNTGAFSTASDITWQLQQAGLELMRLYQDSSVSKTVVEAQAKKVEGLLLLDQTVSTITEQQATQLIIALYELIDKRGT